MHCYPKHKELGMLCTAATDYGDWYENEGDFLATRKQWSYAPERMSCVSQLVFVGLLSDCNS